MSSNASTSVDEKFQLITRRLQEVLGGDLIKEALEKAEQTGQPVRLYWGTAPTGRPHLGYFVPLTKIADFLKAGIHVVILLADVHAFLDNLKAPIELVTHRANYYSRIIHSVFKAIGVPTDRLEFVTGSSYQYKPDYNLDKYRLCAITSEHDAKKAGAEVVKQTESPPLSGLLYPLLQALDEEYLKCDIQFGGVDQRKIFTFAEYSLPRLGYRKRAHLMNAMVPGLAGGKMSASDPNSKIDILDPPQVVKKKIKEAFAAPGEVEGNGLLAFIKSVLLPIAALQERSPFITEDAPAGTVFSVNRPDKHGGAMHYSDYPSLEAAYASETLHPADLKLGVTDAIITLLKPIQEEFTNDPTYQEAEKLAYPPPPEPEKKKKVKKVNPRFAAKPQEGQEGVAEPPTEGVQGVSLEDRVEDLQNGTAAS